MRRAPGPFQLIEQVTDDQVAAEIVSKKGTAHLVPSAEYESLLETMHLLRSPADAERLRAGVAAAHGGRVSERSLGQHSVTAGS